MVAGSRDFPSRQEPTTIFLEKSNISGSTGISRTNFSLYQRLGEGGRELAQAVNSRAAFPPWPALSGVPLSSDGHKDLSPLPKLTP